VLPFSPAVSSEIRTVPKDEEQSKKIRVGIVGAENSHSITVSKILNIDKFPGVEVVAIWEETEEFARKAIEQEHIPRMTKHPEEMLEMIDIESFLYNAWSRKEGYDFWGIGHYVIVSQSTLDQFPKLHTFFKRTNDIVHLQLPTSGFSSAVRSIRQWEDQLKYICYYFDDVDKISGFHKRVTQINNHINDLSIGGNSNLRKWAMNEPRIISPNSKEIFYKYFE